MSNPFELIFSRISRSKASQKIDISSIKTWGKYFFCTSLFSIFLFSSCKNPNNIGLDVIPASDYLNTLFTDTVTVISSTSHQDSLRSDKVSEMLIGSMDDADFGISNASLYSQILLGLTPQLSSSGGTLIADSLILSFVYNGHYGDTLTPLTIHVYRLTTDMYYDSSYYTNSVIGMDSTIDLAGNYQFVPHPSDSVTVGTTNLAPQLRIPLSGSYLKDSLLLFNGQTPFVDNASWTAHFKGIYIKVDPVTSTNQGSVLYFNPLDANTKMTLYYREDTTHKSYDFIFGGAAWFNHQDHDYTGSSVGMQLANSSFNDSLSYIQSMAGLKANIYFPYFNNIISSGKIVINKAELVITTIHESNVDTIFPPPNELLLTAYDSIGGLTYVADYLDPLISFGGLYSPTESTYKINIARHLQRILDGNLTNNGFALNIISSVVQGNRVIIGSGKKSSTNPAKMKLNLFYTKL